MTEQEASKGKGMAFVWWGILAGIAILVLLFALIPKRPAKAPAQEEKAAPVRIEVLRSRAMPDMIELPGRIQGFVEATLSADKPGVVVELGADKGDRVEAGQVLLRVDSRSWENRMRQAEIERREAEKDLARWQELKNTGAVSPSDFDAIQKRKELADIAYRDASVQVSQCQVASPVSGIVNDRMIEKGERAGEGMAVFRVVDLDRVKVAVEVPERDIPFVESGNAMEFEVSAYPGQIFTGDVSFAAVAAAPEGHTYRIELLSPNPDHRLKPGMIAHVRLARRMQPDALVVPLAAVVPRKGEHVVFVARDGRAALCVVQVESISGHEAVIASGLKAGDAVVVEGQRGLQDGTLVEDVSKSSAKAGG